MAINASDVSRWMETELRLKQGSSALQAERQERIVNMRSDDVERIKDIFGLFDSDRRGFIRSANLSLLLKALGCDDETCQSTTIDALTFTLEDLEPLALAALEAGRDGSSEASARKAFRRFIGLASGATDASGNVIGGDVSDANGEDGAASTAQNGLTLKGLVKAFNQCGARATEDEIKEILAFADLDADGVIGEDDWVRVMSFVEMTQ